MTNNSTKGESYKKDYIGLDVTLVKDREKFRPFNVKRDGSGCTEWYSFEDLLILRELINKAIQKYV